MRISYGRITLYCLLAFCFAVVVFFSKTTPTLADPIRPNISVASVDTSLFSAEEASASFGACSPEPAPIGAPVDLPDACAGGGVINPTSPGPGIYCSDITMLDGTIDSDMEVNLTIEHTWVGDLEIVLFPPAGVGSGSITLMMRPQGNTFSNPPDACGGPFGDGNNFTGPANITFADGAASAETIGATGNISGGTFDPTCDNSSNCSGSNSFSDMDGDSAVGTWTMCVRDMALQDSGFLHGWSLNVDPDGSENAACPTPISLAYLHSHVQGDTLTVEWSTAVETSNMGHNIYVITPNGPQQLNDELILSKEISTLTGSDYVFETSAKLHGDSILIEDVDVTGKTRLHGPFSIGTTQGKQSSGNEIDWSPVIAEHEAKAAYRSNQETAAVDQRLVSTRSTSAATPVAYLGVEQDGLQRVTFDDLLAAGFDLSGIAVSDLALTNSEKSIGLQITSAGSTFASGDVIEFLGKAADSPYTNTRNYTLLVDANQAKRVGVDNTVPAGAPPSYYMETVMQGEQNQYDVASRGTSPWYDTRLVAYNSSPSKVFTLPIDNFVAGVETSFLRAHVWGGTALAESPDHHFVVEANGTSVIDSTFDGLKNMQFAEPIADSLLIDNQLTLTMTVPNDLGVLWDVIGVEQYGVTYPRAFVAKADGSLTFTADASSTFEVSGLPTSDISVWRYQVNKSGGTSLLQLSNLSVSGSADNYTVEFAGHTGEEATYFVYTTDAKLQPALTPARPVVDITSDSADYLMISHPDFIDELGDLIAYHVGNGLTVKVVDVRDIYDQFGDGEVSAAAIDKYIETVAGPWGLQYVLLVGNDTFDYLGNWNTGAISFIPSPYAQTGNIVRFSPADPLYADIDNDRVPDLALGRFPVRTSAELAAMISKTVNFESISNPKTALFTADNYDPYSALSFSAISAGMENQLAADWSFEKVYLDNTDVVTAHAKLIDDFNSGTSLISYAGHSGPTVWSWQYLFDTTDASGLTNGGNPALVTQWGCWNNFYVNPQISAIGSELTASGTHGAVAVTGATTLTNGSNESALANLFMGNVTQPGATLGQSMLAAKSELASIYPGLLDVQIGYNILGDPGLVVSEPTVPAAVTLTSQAAQPHTMTIMWVLVTSLGLVSLIGLRQHRRN